MEFIVDCHNDTGYELYYKKENLCNNSLHIDIEKMKNYRTLLCYAIFIDPNKFQDDVDTYFYNIYHNLVAELTNNKINIINNIGDFEKSIQHTGIITLEGGNFIDSLKKVEILKKLGIKAVNLTWNNSNKIATSQMSGDKGGVSDFGYKVIDKMIENKIIIDLSHISDQSFYDVLDYVKTPILVSHSNARSLCEFPRNITDDMFKRVMKNGGLVGINFCCDFLGKDPNIETIIDHIEYFLNLGGEENLCFGSDFDGIPCLPNGLNSISDFDKIIEAMKNRGFNNQIIEKITNKNFINFLSNF